MMDEQWKKTVYLSVHATTEFGESPAFARWEMTPEAVARIRELRELCATHGLSQCNDWYSIDWDNDEEFRLRGEELIVGPGYFWFTGHPKYADFDIETHALTYDDLDALCESDPGEVAYPYDDSDDLKEIIIGRMSEAQV